MTYSGRGDAGELHPSERWGRRKFVKGISALAGAAGFSCFDLRPAAAEPPPEVTRIRLVATPAICVAPEYIAEPLLNAEGFTDVQWLRFETTIRSEPLLSRTADMNMDAVGDVIHYLDAGAPMVALAGMHLGCYELFANEHIRAIRDLKGKTIPIDGQGGPQHVFLSSMAAYVGLDPRKDIRWVEQRSSSDGMQLFADGKVDAFLAFPPQPQELRARKIGHVVLNTAIDRPWSQYYCCMLVGSREFVSNYPAATKRAVRAMLKAADLCAREPERAARMMIEKGFAQRYEYALETLKEVSYDAWRTYDPDTTIRFHALRLHEVGMIKSDPNRLIAQGTDWRFLNELKKELKA